jgi:hypothetical protein
VRQAAAGGGFKPAARSDEQVYRSAAEEFFRPEFFNRIDRIVPFHRLGRGDIEAIARKLIAGLFARDGLVQRQCVLRIDPAAMDRIVKQGYHPDLGARALKRTIERQMTAPVAGRLAALPPGTPTVLSLYPAGRDGIAVQTQGLVLAKAGPPPTAAVDLSDADAALDRLYDVLARVDDQIADLLPDGSVSHADLRPEHHRYFAVREQAGRLRRMLGALEGRAARPTAIPGPAPRYGPRPVRPVKERVLRWWGVRSHGWMFQEAAAATDLREYLAERSAGAEAYGGSAADRLTDAVHEASLLAAMAGSDPDGDRVILHLRTIAENRPPPPKTAVAPRPAPSKPAKPAKPGKPAAKAPAKPKSPSPAVPAGPVEKMAALYRELIAGQWGYSATDLSVEGEPLR